jgi:hypothetical protein
LAGCLHSPDRAVIGTQFDPPVETLGDDRSVTGTDDNVDLARDVGDEFRTRRREAPDADERATAGMPGFDLDPIAGLFGNYLNLRNRLFVLSAFFDLDDCLRTIPRANLDRPIEGIEVQLEKLVGRETVFRPARCRPGDRC